jgi:hypothetical protein
VTNLEGTHVTGLDHGGLVAASRAMHAWLLNTLATA